MSLVSTVNNKINSEPIKADATDQVDDITADKVQEIAQNALNIDFLELLPDELIQQIGKDVPLTGLAGLANQNSCGRANTNTLFLQRAKEFGFQGETTIGAKNYLKALCKEVTNFCDDGLLSAQYISRKAGEVDPEATLRNLKTFTMAEIFAIFSKKGAYSDSYKKLQRLLFQHAKTLPLAGANPNIQNEKGEAILHTAVRFDCKEVVELLVKHQANLDIQTEQGETALHLCVALKKDNFVTLLCQNQADLDITGVDGKTALHIAVQKGDINTVATLLRAGADPTILDFEDRSPMDLAEYLGHTSIKSLILEYVLNLD